MATVDHVELVARLSHPEHWGAGPVEVIHTHASVVFRLPERVYKLKRPVDLGFLDYSTPALREQMCHAEVELNRRLSPDVYLGVEPIVVDGEVVEHAVVMRRLPDDATLGARVETATLDDATIDAVARSLAAFHRSARRGPDLAEHVAPPAVRRNIVDNLEALARWGDSLPRALVDALAVHSERALAEHASLIDARATGTRPCEGHGDLRLEHVYLLPPDDRLAIIDCIEFSLAFRALDPIADVAFLSMDLRAHGAWWAAERLWTTYLGEAGDDEGAPLVPLYESYRSLVRAKVRMLQAHDGEATAQERARAAELASAHVRVAAAVLLPAIERPSLVLVAGLPGTGKSVLAHGLAEHAGYTWIRADSVRKELAGLEPSRSAHADVRAGIYTPQWNDRTYDECLARAAEVLARGGRVVVDASFKERRRRKAFVDAATHLGVRLSILVCTTPPTEAHRRLDVRHDDPSDADWHIYQHVEATWEPLGPRCQRASHVIDTSGSPEASLRQATDALGL